jgi:hypothetical protein
MTEIEIRYCERHGYVEGRWVQCPACDGYSTANVWTAFCARPESPRGEYDEEIDVVSVSRYPTAARKLAEAAIDHDYRRDLRVRRVVKRGPGLFF